MPSQDSINQRFAKVVDELLRLNKIESQTELAEKLGYKSKSSISGIISGNQKPSIDNIAALRTMFGVSIEYMISGKMPMFAGDTGQSSQGKKIENPRTYTKEEIEEQVRLHSSSGHVTLLDEFSLRVIGFTLWEAFLMDKLDRLDNNVTQKVSYCKRYAAEYYRQRLEEGFSQSSVEGKN